MDPHPIVQRLLASLADAAGIPVTQVIVDDLWLAVVDGSLEVGERLPTARELAIALRVSPRIVQRAYDELGQRGVLASRPGEGTFVSLAPPSEAERERRRRLADLGRESLEQARALGFDVDDLLEVLADYRMAREAAPLPESRP